MNKKYLFLLVLLVPLGIGVSFADTGLKDCAPNPALGMDILTQCLNNIYNQNIELNQQQAQMNHLLATEVCSHTSSFNDNVFSPTVKNAIGMNIANQDYITFHQCVKQVLDDTK